MRKRLPVLVVMGWLAVVALCPAASAQQKTSTAGRTLRVATWGGAWQDIRYRLVGQPLEKALGIKVEWVPGNPVDHLARMIAARGGDPPFDVAELGTIETVQARELGFLEKLQRDLAPNLQQMDPALVAADAVPFVATEYVIAYLPGKFKELGLPAPARIEDLFHPKLKRRFALPFIGGSTMGPRFLATLAIEQGGSIANIEPALDRLKDVQVSYYYRATSELEMRMLAGEVWAAYWSISRPFLQKVEGRNIDYVSVGPGGKKATAAISNLAIVKSSKNKDLAHAYVNQALALSAQYGMAEWGGIRPVSHEGVKKVLASGNANLRRIAEVPWKDVFTIDFPPDVEIVSKNLGKWLDQFDREVGARQ